jgi:hypothetical protein
MSGDDSPGKLKIKDKEERKGEKREVKVLRSSKWKQR